MVVTKTVDCAMQHSVCLLPEIDGALKEAGLALEDCDFFACAVGPGSFTGIRIGISTVKGLAFALGKPTLGVTSLRAIAYAEEGCRAALVDAGHGNVYAEGFGFSLPQGFYRAEEVVLRAKEAGARLLAGEEVPLGGVEYVDPARGLARYCDGHAAQTGGLAAVYLRRSSAEEGR